MDKITKNTNLKIENRLKLRVKLLFKKIMVIKKIMDMIEINNKKYSFNLISTGIYLFIKSGNNKDNWIKNISPIAIKEELTNDI